MSPLVSIIMGSTSDLPVIGVPIKGMLDGLDAMLSIIQMPPGIPVATVGVNGAQNAAILAAEILKPEKLVGADISEGMMEIGRQKVKEKGLEQIISFEKEDCLALSYPNGSFDAVTAAFGIRNFADLDKGLKEMQRVLKEGGHLSIVELTTPVNFPMKQLFHIYSHTVLPLYGRLISKDTSAYAYLTKTIEAFPQGERMVEILKKAGFKEASFKRLTFGICTMYFATK